MQNFKKLNSVHIYRWEISVEHTDESDVADQIPLNIINNYCSIGVVSVLWELMRGFFFIKVSTNSPCMCHQR
jgi:hypothetical protein